MSYRALDYHFSVHAEDPWVAEKAARLFGSLADPTPATHSFRMTGGAGSCALERDGKPISGPRPLAETLDQLVGELNAAAVASRPNALMLHAATLSLDGVGVVLPGDPGRGKSTLAQALIAAGLGYLTDEVAAVDPVVLTVDPYPKPLSVAEGLVPVDGSATAVPVGAIIFPFYAEGAPVALEPMSRAEAAVELANDSFNFLGDGRRMLPVLRRLVLASWCGRLRMGDRSAAAAAVVEFLNDRERCLAP